MMHHYGTTPLIRQCVTPGMMAMHEGRTYRVSAVIQERKWVYLHTDAEIIRLSDCVIDVLLDGHGNSYALTGQEAPWQWWNDRDVRTVVEMGKAIGIDPKRDMPFEGTRHSALDDAIHQVKYVSAIWQKLIK